MKNKIFTVVCLLLAGLILIPCYGQQNQQNRRKSKVPEVPKTALLPAVSTTYFEKEVKDFVDHWSKLPFPNSAKAYRANATKSPELSSGKIRQRIIAFRHVVQHPDLEEVMKQHRGWYFDLYNASLPLVKAADMLYDLRAFPSEQKYQQVRKIFVNVIADLNEIYDEKPEKLPREELRKITKQNQERRKNEWLKKYYADQKRKQLEAKSGKKENKKVTKKDDRNDKDRSSRKDRKRKESAK